MSKFCWLIPVLFLIALTLAGCGNDQERGIYRDKDKPRAADKADR
jgi:hypothetical protein